MVKQTQLALNDASEWLGDWHPLAEQLGSASGLVTLASVSALLKVEPVHTVPTLQNFIKNYYSKILFPLEWPAITKAHNHANFNEVRELIALDQSLAGVPILKDFSAPSHRVGQSQLQKLRPLKDQRLIQRYLAAVEARHASAWHTLVYGLTMAVYSLPLRQGLLGYAHQTTRGFIYSAAPMLKLSEHNCRGIFDEVCAPLPLSLETLLKELQVPVVQ